MGRTGLRPPGLVLAATADPFAPSSPHLRQFRPTSRGYCPTWASRQWLSGGIRGGPGPVSGPSYGGRHGQDPCRLGLEPAGGPQRLGTGVECEALEPAGDGLTEIRRDLGRLVAVA